MSKTISQDDYLRLVGLLTIAADHRRILESIERSACTITGDKPGAGQHTGDAVWGGHLVTAEQLLELLDITVGQPSTTPPGPPAGAGAQAGEQVARAMGFARRIAALDSES